MNRKSILLVCLLLLFIIDFSFSQSTTGWIRVKSSDDSNFITNNIEFNSSYITVRFVKSRINDKSNWWTQLVQKNRMAIIMVDLSINYSDQKYDNKWTGPNVKIEKSYQPIDLGWNKILVDRFPTTFSSMDINVKICSTASDGLDGLIQLASDISKDVPPLAISDMALGIISSSKKVADYLFNKNLIVTHILCNNSLLSSDYGFYKPGYYVVFGDETANNYEKYVSDKTNLFWDGATLKYTNVSITNTGYFIILVDYMKNVFSQKNLNILSNIKKPWARLYIQANQTINSLNSTNDIDAIKNKIRPLLLNAKVILDEDLDYVYLEKQDIDDTLRKIINERLSNRIETIISGGVK